VRMTGIAKGTVAKLAVEIYFQTDPLPSFHTFCRAGTTPRRSSALGFCGALSLSGNWKRTND